MSRTPNLERSVDLHVRVKARTLLDVQAILYSDAHGRIPYGSLGSFIEDCIQEKLARIRKQLDEEQGYGSRSEFANAGEDRSVAPSGARGDD